MKLYMYIPDVATYETHMFNHCMLPVCIASYNCMKCIAIHIAAGVAT